MNYYKLLLITLLIALGVTACGPDSVPNDIPTQPPTQLPEVIPHTETLDHLQEMFVSAANCAACHNNLTDEAGKDVSIAKEWQAGIMAHAVDDPYYRATVSSEIITHPELQGVIEDKCATCHMPMAHFATKAAGGETRMFGAEGFLSAENSLHDLAMEGVSCTACHQLAPETYTQDDSTSGNMLFDTETLKGKRSLYGPYTVDETQANIMSAASGFLPVLSDHLADSQMCATCHTLYTNYLLEDGSLSETLFPEQTPYLEWENSSFADNTSCQDCHMPTAEGGVVLSITGGEARSPFLRHSFAGANVYMLRILQEMSKTTDISSTAEELETSILETMDMLQKQTADLSIDSVEIIDSSLAFEITIRTKVGHKFPSGYPSRRAWLHVTVRDLSGAVIFESGAVSASGEITDNDNDRDPTIFEPHYLEITTPDQVQIYESILLDDGGAVTTGLLYAASYVKDNRLLPSGFDIANASADIAIQGQATSDEDFLGGGDTTKYIIAVDPANGPFTVTAELLYQSIGYRWAQNLAPYATAETDEFIGFYDAVSNLPVSIAIKEIVNP